MSACLTLGGMLGGNDHVLDHDRLVVLVADRDLGLGVGAQPADQAGLAHLGQLAAETMGIHDRSRHHLRRLVAGIAEHQSLVPCALLGRFLALRRPGIDSLRDVGRLAREVVVDEDPVGMEHVVIVDVPDVADGGAHDLFVVQFGLGGDLSGDDHHVRFDHRLARHAAPRILFDARVEHAVRNQIGHLVGMTFAHGLG